MSHDTHHLFISYARKDNEAHSTSGQRWVSAFVERLKSQHTFYAGRPLKVFFDEEEIDEGSDWRRRLGQGLRTSRLFLAFLSENYLRSVNCRWEWDEYLLREHILARGDDGVTPIFFVTVPGMPGSKDDPLAKAFEAELQMDSEAGRWLDRLKDELQRRQSATDRSDKHNPRAVFDFRRWFAGGPEILQQLDATERIDGLRVHPHEACSADIRELAARLGALAQRISIRLDRCILAEVAPGNIARSYAHFVGRSRELRDLHNILISERVGVIAALHGMGGLGKTAMAVQYAHAYAEFYAAGGRWVVNCDGLSGISQALVALADDPTLDCRLTAEQRNDESLAVRIVIEHIRTFMLRNAATLRQQLIQHEECNKPIDDLDSSIFRDPRVLIIFDNVDRSEFLSASQTGILPQDEWLSIIVTTRLNPASFGACHGSSALHAIPIDPLPEQDSLALLRDWLASEDTDWRRKKHGYEDRETQAAELDLVRALGGYTLVLELVAAYLRANHVSPASYFRRLEKEGLTSTDHLATDDATSGLIRHREKQLSVILSDTLESLQNAGVLGRISVLTLRLASFFHPDMILSGWLYLLVKTLHPVELEPKDGYADPWTMICRELSGRRLFHFVIVRKTDHADRSTAHEFARLHRLVSEHLFRNMPNQGELFVLVESMLWDLGRRFEEQVLQGQDFNLTEIHPILRAHFDHIMERCPTHKLLIAANVSATYEANHGQLSLGLAMTERILQLKRPILNQGMSLGIDRSISVSLNCVGDMLLRRGRDGDFKHAVKCFEESLAISRQITSKPPESSEARSEAISDLASALERLGTCYLYHAPTPDVTQALKLFNECHDHRKSEAYSHPENAQSQRSLVVLKQKLVDAYMKRGLPGDSEVAELECSECLVALTQLIDRFPAHTTLQRDLYIQYGRLAELRLKTAAAGSADIALGMHLMALDIAKNLHSSSPYSTLWCNLLVGAFNNVAGAALRCRKFKIGTYMVVSGQRLLYEMDLEGIEIDAKTEQIAESWNRPGSLGWMLRTFAAREESDPAEPPNIP